MDSQTTIQAPTNDKGPQPRCYLLELPAELRLHIYEYVFEGITLRGALLNYDDYFPFPNYFPINNGTNAVLRSCRQIFTEARPVLYNQLSFKLIVCGISERRARNFHSDDIVPQKNVLPLMRNIEFKFCPADACDQLMRLAHACTWHKCLITVGKVSLFERHPFKDTSHEARVNWTVEFMGWVEFCITHDERPQELYREILERCQDLLKGTTSQQRPLAEDSGSEADSSDEWDCDGDFCDCDGECHCIGDPCRCG
jgi:hypothetical protein